jgi:hypothetical protein
MRHEQILGFKKALILGLRETLGHNDSYLQGVFIVLRGDRKWERILSYMAC